VPNPANQIVLGAALLVGTTMVTNADPLPHIGDKSAASGAAVPSGAPNPEPPSFLARGFAGLKGMVKDVEQMLSAPDPHPVRKDIDGVVTDISKSGQPAQRSHGYSLLPNCHSVQPSPNTTIAVAINGVSRRLSGFGRSAMPFRDLIALQLPCPMQRRRATAYPRRRA